MTLVTPVAKITFGDRSFDIRPLSVGQVEAIEPLIAENEGKALSIKMAVSIIAIGISRDNPMVDVRTIQGTVPEIGAAMQVVLSQGGFIPEPLSGEAAAAAAVIAESISGLSTAA